MHGSNQAFVLSSHLLQQAGAKPLLFNSLHSHPPHPHDLHFLRTCTTRMYSWKSTTPWRQPSECSTSAAGGCGGGCMRRWGSGRGVHGSSACSSASEASWLTVRYCRVPLMSCRGGRTAGSNGGRCRQEGRADYGTPGRAGQLPPPNPASPHLMEAVLLPAAGLHEREDVWVGGAGGRGVGERRRRERRPAGRTARRCGCAAACEHFLRTAEGCSGERGALREDGQGRQQCGRGGAAQGGQAGV